MTSVTDDASRLPIFYGDGPRAIYNSLKDRIVSGEIASGKELKIQAVAEHYGVSIVPVREAIRMLAADDLIELRPRRSPIVAIFDERELVEINQIRLALEPMVLESAIDNHTQETLDDCRQIVALDEASTDLWEKVSLNRRFHLALLGPSPLKRTLRIIEEQFEGISRVAQFIVVDSGVFLGHPHHEHQEILDAVASGKTTEAVNLLRSHIKKSTERARSGLTDRASGSTAEQSG